jgi:hypothetical protein
MPEELIEQLAAIEHERWADWQRYLHSKCERADTWDDGSLVIGGGGLVIPAELVEHWERQIATPYAELTEAEKESDREQVRRYLHLVGPK